MLIVNNTFIFLYGIIFYSFEIYLPNYKLSQDVFKQTRMPVLLNSNLVKL